jgi:hypothetical protein
MGADLGDKGGCSMAVMIVKVPLHWGKCSISISNTCLSRRAKASYGQAPREGAPHRGSLRGIGVDLWRKIRMPVSLRVY